MKKNYTINEFKEYCDKNKPKSIIYLSENQTRDWVSDTCKINICFPIILIFENPNIVCLKLGTNIMCFDLVKSVDIDSDSYDLGTVVSLNCGLNNEKGERKVYTLVFK